MNKGLVVAAAVWVMTETVLAESAAYWCRTSSAACLCRSSSAECWGRTSAAAACWGMAAADGLGMAAGTPRQEKKLGRQKER